MKISKMLKIPWQMYNNRKSSFHEKIHFFMYTISILFTPGGLLSGLLAVLYFIPEKITISFGNVSFYHPLLMELTCARNTQDLKPYLNFN